MVTSLGMLETNLDYLEQILDQEIEKVSEVYKINKSIKDEQKFIDLKIKNQRRLEVKIDEILDTIDFSDAERKTLIKVRSKWTIDAVKNLPHPTGRRIRLDSRKNREV